MLLSVVVPFFNVEPYIWECLDSILAQDVRDIEVILVDDGSTDGTRAICEELAATDPRIRIVTQENQGLGPARNTGTSVATGRYLTFVDSDDIVPRRGWQRMVGSLERTGSDFATGDARRFNSQGVRRSWLHEQYLSDSRPRTTLAAFPELANDRMVWNKIYRRSFWDAGGYAFPAQLYEDYPVTFRALLDARSVDVVAEPVYLWRERDAGEHSITQRALELSNIRDRVTSAEAVLELAERAAPEARRVVHHHLAGPDIGTLLRAVALPVNEPDVPALLELARRLLDRLDPEVLAGRRPLERLGVGLLRYGGVEQIRAWQRIRVQTPPPAGHRTAGLFPRRRLLTFPGTDLEPVDPAARRVTEQEVDLDGRIRSARWHEGVLHLEAQVWTHFAPPGARPEVTAWMVRPGRPRVPLEVDRVVPDGATVRATLRLDGEALATQAQEPGDWELVVRLRAEGARREGRLTRIRPGSATVGTAWVRDDRTWLVPGKNHADVYVVRVVRPEVVITDVAAHRPGELALTGTSSRPLPASGALLAVRGEGREIQVPLITGLSDPHRWEARIRLADVTDADADELLDGRSEYRFALLTPGAQDPVLLAPGIPVARYAHRDREVQLTFNRFLEAQLEESAPHLVLETAALSGDILRLTGRWLDARTTLDHVLLRWHHLAERPEEIRVPLTFDGDSFCFEIDLAGLSARVAAVLAADPEADETPAEHEWLISADHLGLRANAHLAASLVRVLPDPHRAPSGSVELSTFQRFTARLLVTDVSAT